MAKALQMQFSREFIAEACKIVGIDDRDVAYVCFDAHFSTEQDEPVIVKLHLVVTRAQAEAILKIAGEKAEAANVAAAQRAIEEA